LSNAAFHVRFAAAEPRMGPGIRGHFWPAGIRWWHALRFGGPHRDHAHIGMHNNRLSLFLLWFKFVWGSLCWSYLWPCASVDLGAHACVCLFS